MKSFIESYKQNKSRFSFNVPVNCTTIEMQKRMIMFYVFMKALKMYLLNTKSRWDLSYQEHVNWKGEIVPKSEMSVTKTAAPQLHVIAHVLF